MKTAKVVLENVKDADGWADLMTSLGVPQEEWGRHLEYGEFASLELEVDRDLKVVGGRIIPRKA